MNMRHLLFLGLCGFLFFLFSYNAEAATFYVLPSPGGVSGTSGSDWAHACSDFTGNCAPGSLVRGDTYYVGGGNYSGGYTFSAADSGTSTIIIEGATVGSHATSTGWQASYSVSKADGGGPAIFGLTGCTGGYPGCSAISFTTDYWTIDGAVGSGSASSSYGFSIPLPSSCSTATQEHVLWADGSNTTIRHFALAGCAGYDIEKIGVLFGTTGQTAISSDTLEYTYFTGWQNAVALYALTGGNIDNIYHTDGDSTANHHGAAIDTFSTADISFFDNIMDECPVICFAGNVGSQIAMNGWAIYGNLFTKAGGGAAEIAGEANGIANTVIYNNTFAGGGGTWFWQGDSPCTGCTGNVTRNNLIWNQGCSISTNGGGAVDSDYDTFLSCTDSAPTETHGQTGNFNPFANSSAGNYQLAQDGGTGANQVNVGTTLGSPYNIDMNGLTRGADGTWERGAYEVDSLASTNRYSLILIGGITTIGLALFL